MKLQQLMCFDEIANSGSFTAAANKLFLSQPSVSYNIRELEKELGVQLLERSLNATKAELTEYGQILVEPVKEILLQVKECEAVFADLNSIQKKRISLLVSNALIYSVVPDLVKYSVYQLPTMDSVIPRIDICYSMQDAENELRNKNADLVLYAEIPSDEFEYTPLFQDELVAFIPTGYFPGYREWVTLRELSELPIALPLRDNAQMGNVIRKMFEYEGIEPIISEYGAKLPQSRMTGVMLGKCYTITSNFPLNIRGVERVRIDNPHNKRQVYAVWRKDQQLSRNMQYMIEFCKQYEAHF